MDVGLRKKKSKYHRIILMTKMKLEEHILLSTSLPQILQKNIDGVFIDLIMYS